MVRDVMVCDFPSVRTTDNLAEIDRVARAHPNIKSLPVMGGNDQLVGIIHAEELHRVLDTDVVARLVNADDIATKSPVSISADANLIEALRDFGLRDVDTLPVINGAGGSPTLVGLLLRADVTRRYREELLRNN